MLESLSPFATMKTCVLHLALLALADISIARIYSRFEDLPNNSYDYVIVGAGTAGNTLANRLTEDSKLRVLVIEAGPSDEDITAVAVPFLAETVTPNTPYDWNYTVVPQVGLNNRQFPQARGRILGGSSSANYMVHQYGSSDDYDKLARITGDNGWSWSQMKRYVFKHERIVPPTDKQDTSHQYISAAHGTHGTLPVTLPGITQTTNDRVIAATRQLSEFPYLADTATPENILGMGWIQQSIGGGARSSSSTSYLREANSRPNLSVLTNAQVTQLVNTGLEKGKPSFRGVKFAIGPDRRENTVFAKEEVILSAGSIGTPQILLLSGIGPRNELSKLGIRTLINNPSVGDNLSDHVQVSNVFEVRGNQSLDWFLRDSAQQQVALDEWTKSKTGLFANSRYSQLGFFRFPKNATLFSGVADPSSGLKAAHWEVYVSNFWDNPIVPQPPTGSFFSLTSVLICPSSRGSIKLSSPDPFAKPLIDPNMVTTKFDQLALRETVRAVKRFASAEAWSDYIIGPVGSLAGDSDDDIDSHVRQFGATVQHPVGTASLSSSSSHEGVVDQELRVKGAEGLRVVDASVWPFLPSGHTQGLVYLVAERAADLIKRDSKGLNWVNDVPQKRLTNKGEGSE